LSWDELTIYFHSKNTSGVSQLLFARRSSIDEDFGTPAVLANVNSGLQEAQPMVAKSDLTLYFVSDRDGNDNLYAASRVVGGDPGANPFTDPRPLLNLNSSVSDQAPFLSADASELWFTTDQPTASSPFRIFRAAGPAFNAGAAVAELDTAGANISPTLSADGLTVYFGSDRAGTLGQRDIWFAKRAGPGASFGTVASASTLNVALNSAGDDLPSWVSADDCRLYLTSSRPGLGGSDIYLAQRPK
jgi:Tol biopolymer transport system component